ncbi:MAG: PD40 domain-containing protein [Rhodothermales bacterium]|nr:PD40 domain-containing protein [Rhodothermales bacterium]
MAFRITGWLTMAVLMVGLAHDAVAQSGSEGGLIASPKFSPSNPDIIAFERQRERTRVIGIRNERSGSVHVVELDERWSGAQDCGGLFEERDCSEADPGYRGELAWRPTLSRDGSQWFVYVSGERGGGFELLLARMDGDQVSSAIPVPLDLIQVREPTWTEDGELLVFRGQLREGGEDLFAIQDLEDLFSLAEATSTDLEPVPVERLTWTPEEPELGPTFSPGGQSLAYQHRVRGVFAVSVIDVGAALRGDRADPIEIAAIELEGFDRYKPSWSPDGRFLAFYTSSEAVQEQAERTLQDVAVAQVLYYSGTRQVSRGQLLVGASGRRIARGVLPNERMGPQWIATGGRTGILYVEKDEAADYPARLRWIEQWMGGAGDSYEEDLSGTFRTVNNQELTASACGVLRFAFASQQGSRMRLEVREGPRGAAVPACVETRDDYNAGAAVTRSLLIPGQGQAYKGQRRRAWMYRAAVGVGALGAAGAFSQAQSFGDDYEAALASAVNECPAGRCRGATLEARFEEIQADYDSYSSKRSQGKLLLALTASAWLASAVDAGIGAGRPSGASLRVFPTIMPLGGDRYNAGLGVNLKLGRRD